ncbi:MAG TPA: DUF1631 family protein, partial [Noviherbaspirillum sp.]|nr:DUF1631 family protein [Noviherbaspirillum sp.]
MADNEYKRLIVAAKDCAHFGFLALVQRAMQDADAHIVGLLAKGQSGRDHAAMTWARHFLRQYGTTFLRRIDPRFRDGLERAMQTMYVDMRPGMRKLSADELSLVDDEVVSHQIEVGRLTARMRDANEEIIGRLNVIIGQLHGAREARERENPFRPYLLARAMYDAVRETVDDEQKAKVLFEHLSNALIAHLPAYYSAIHDVFGASGVQGKFMAQRSRAAHHQRYFGAPHHLTPPPTAAHMMPGLQRALEVLQTASSAASISPGPVALQDFMRTMFGASETFLTRAANGAGKGGTPAVLPVNHLLTQLTRYQKEAANVSQESDKPADDAEQVAAWREQLSLDKASLTERMTVEMVTMLFASILEDEQMPPALRQQIGRLQIPVLKAALLEPELMREEGHPARRLLNRIGAAAIAADPETSAGQKLAGEIERAVDRILAEFDTDTGIFADSIQAIEQIMADCLRQDNRQVTNGIDAVEAAEKYSILLANTTTVLCEILLPLNTDKRISDLIIHVWPHVLVRAAEQDARQGIASNQLESAVHQYRAVLPELLWSVQEKSNAHERTALMRLLPDLVRRLKKALQLARVPEDESRPILDQLVEMHTAALRSASKKVVKEVLSLDDLRQAFSRLVIDRERISWGLDEPPQVRAAIIEEIFTQRGVVATLHLDAHIAAASLADRALLAQTYLLGTRVAFRADDRTYLPGQVVWTSTHRSLYLFKREQDGGLVLYTFASLMNALRDEAIVAAESAPIFERAVDS